MSYSVARSYEEQTNNVDDARKVWQSIVQARCTPDEVAVALRAYKRAVHGLLAIIPLKHNVSEAILGQFYTDNITSLNEYYSDFFAMRPDMAKVIQSTITSLERELAELRDREAAAEAEAAAAAVAAAEAARRQELEAAYQHRDALEAELARVQEAWHAYRMAGGDSAAAAEAVRQQEFEAARQRELEAIRQQELDAAYRHRAELEARLEALTQRVAAADAAAAAEAQAVANRLARRHDRDHFDDDADAQQLIINFGCIHVTKRPRQE